LETQCSRIFGQNTKFVTILSTATGENRFVLVLFILYCTTVMVNKDEYIYTLDMQFQVIILCLHTWAAIRGDASPLSNWSGGVNGIVSPKFVVFVNTLSRLFCVCGSCWRNLQPSPNPFAIDLSGRSAGRGRQR